MSSLRRRHGLAPAFGGAVLGFGACGETLAQQAQRRARVARDQEVGLHFPERKARRERIARDVDDLGVPPRSAAVRGNPRHHAVEHHDHVGLGDPRGSLEAEMHRVIGRQVEVARLGLHHRQRELIRERGELGHRGRVASHGRGYDQRKLRLGDQVCGFFDDVAGRFRRGHAERSHGVAARVRCRIGQHLAWQCQIDRPARLGHRDVERAVDHGVGRLAGAQLVVPFHEFAHHAALVERLLAPMDRAVAGGDVAGLGDRRAAGGAAGSGCCRGRRSSGRRSRWRCRR